MGYWEKITWSTLSATLIVAVAYGAYIGLTLIPEGAEPSAYWAALVVAIIAHIVVTVVLTVTRSILTAAQKGEVDETWDERDNTIEHRADRISNYAQSSLLIAVLFAAAWGLPHHIIGTGIMAGLLGVTLLHAATKIVLYKRGV